MKQLLWHEQKNRKKIELDPNKEESGGNNTYKLIVNWMGGGGRGWEAGQERMEGVGRRGWVGGQERLGWAGR